MLLARLTFWVILLYRPKSSLSIICATDPASWKERSKNVTCGPQEHYHCGILVTGDVAEFCFTSEALSAKVCPRFDIFLRREISTVPCTQDGCPADIYISSQLYLFPICSGSSTVFTTTETSTLTRKKDIVGLFTQTERSSVDYKGDVNDPQSVTIQFNVSENNSTEEITNSTTPGSKVDMKTLIVTFGLPGVAVVFMVLLTTIGAHIVRKIKFKRNINVSEVKTNTAENGDGQSEYATIDESLVCEKSTIRAISTSKSVLPVATSSLSPTLTGPVSIPDDPDDSIPDDPDDTVCREGTLKTMFREERSLC